MESQVIYVPNTEEARKLIELAKNKKRNRLYFSNSAEGVALRLNVKENYTGQGSLKHCTLRDQQTDGYRDHRAT